MRKKINFNSITYFMSVVDAGSITGAARTLGVSKSVISKQISDLEALLQTNLLIRTPKQLLPSRAGEAFYRRCLAGVEAIESAYLDAQDHGSIPQGELRILANSAYGKYVLLPVVHAFSARYPACTVRFVLSDDLSEQEQTWFDLAIRTRPLDDPSLHVRRIDSFERRLVVAAAHVERFGCVDGFERLAELPFIGYVNHLGQAGWSFTNGTDQRHLVLEPALSVSPVSVVLDSLLEGYGYSILPSFIYDHPAFRPKLRLILPEWSAETGSVYAYTYPSRQRSAAVKVFLEWVACAVQGLPFPDPPTNAIRTGNALRVNPSAPHADI
ncbi:LysR family transcriptional regulator [Swaminathania salitolerans]|nr:LysR family transcriptional regulator [Swaminathania salitolerans]